MEAKVGIEPAYAALQADDYVYFSTTYLICHPICHPLATM